MNILNFSPKKTFYFRPHDIKQFVLDEADEMLSRGFKDQIYDVFRHLSSEIQVGVLLAFDCGKSIKLKLTITGYCLLIVLLFNIYFDAVKRNLA